MKNKISESLILLKIVSLFVFDKKEVFFYQNKRKIYFLTIFNVSRYDNTLKELREGITVKIEWFSISYDTSRYNIEMTLS